MQSQLPNIIGLLGRARRGKDTVANYIIKKYPCYTNIKLSKPIKDAAKSLYDFTYEQLEGSQKEIIDPRWNISPRDAMVFITSTFMNKMGTDFFSKRLFGEFDVRSPAEVAAQKHIIISDVRYENDLAEIKKRNGIIIKIIRDIEPYHEWESQIDTFTVMTNGGENTCQYTISNNGSLADLYKSIDDIFASIKSDK
uniref:Deoxynucleoside monophosphate kinase n=1 Tax=viral metagenome TaxID=1070528 RepID=A0A6C0KUV3_9ZZZZ